MHMYTYTYIRIYTHVYIYMYLYVYMTHVSVQAFISNALDTVSSLYQGTMERQIAKLYHEAVRRFQIPVLNSGTWGVDLAEMGLQER